MMPGLALGNPFPDDYDFMNKKKFTDEDFSIMPIIQPLADPTKDGEPGGFAQPCPASNGLIIYPAQITGGACCTENEEPLVTTAFGSMFQCVEKTGDKEVVVDPESHDEEVFEVVVPADNADDAEDTTEQTQFTIEVINETDLSDNAAVTDPPGPITDESQIEPEDAAAAADDFSFQFTHNADPAAQQRGETCTLLMTAGAEQTDRLSSVFLIAACCVALALGLLRWREGNREAGE
jgi:hypothetical protein